MKGVIAIAVREMTQTQYGKEAWTAALKKAGIETEPLLLPVSDVSDEAVVSILGALSTTLGKSPIEIADVFGEYWVSTFAQRLYRSHFQGAATARELLLKMDNVHVVTTEEMPGARPPRFEYEWKDENTLLMKYRSHRGLIDLMAGLVRGVGKHYKENLKVRTVSNQTLEISFC
ncbi:MAG: heme NO-binding domain-containing protein [Pseudomonadota bacterium]